MRVDTNGPAQKTEMPPLGKVNPDTCVCLNGQRSPLPTSGLTEQILTGPELKATRKQSQPPLFYTGKGDEGYTGLLGSERMPKYDLRPEACGTVDEANTFLGLVRAEPAAGDRTKQAVLTAQSDLWVIMGELSCCPGVELPTRLTAGRVAWLETEIEQLAAEIPPLNHFVTPGDTMVSARLEAARATIRRAERSVCRLLHEGYLKNHELVRYLNRLSSLLFVLARYEENRVGCRTTLAKEI